MDKHPYDRFPSSCQEITLQLGKDRTPLFFAGFLDTIVEYENDDESNDSESKND